MSFVSAERRYRLRPCGAGKLRLRFRSQIRDRSAPPVPEMRNARFEGLLWDELIWCRVSDGVEVAGDARKRHRTPREVVRAPEALRRPIGCLGRRLLVGLNSRSGMSPPRSATSRSAAVAS